MATTMNKFRSLVRTEVKKAIGTTHISRVRMIDQVLTQGTTADFNLLVVDDDPDYDLASDGTNIAEVQALTKLRKIELTFIVNPGGTGSERIEYMLYRDPDATLVGSVPSSLFTADVSLASQALRKNAIAYGMFISTANKDTTTRRLFIRRQAMARVQTLRDGDRLRMAIAHSAAAADGLMWLYGRIWTRLG